MWPQYFLAKCNFHQSRMSADSKLLTFASICCFVAPYIYKCSSQRSYLVFGKSPHSAVAHKLGKVQPLLQEGCDCFCLSTIFVLLCWHYFVNTLCLHSSFIFQLQGDLLSLSLLLLNFDSDSMQIQKFCSSFCSVTARGGLEGLPRQRGTAGC